MKRNVLAALLIGLAAIAAQAAPLIPKDPGPETAVPALRPYLVQIATPNVDAAEKWYRDNLGFAAKSRMENEDRSLRIVFLERDGVLLEMVQDKDLVSPLSLKPEVTDRSLFQGMVKLSFETPDIGAATARLKANGVRFRMDVTVNAASKDKFNLFYDGDGNLVQFIQKSSTPPGSPLRPCVFAILVPDVAAAARWYAALLGFTPGPTYGDDNLKVIFLTLGDFKLELVQDKRSVSPEALKPGLDPLKVQGFTKIGFLAAGFDPLAQALKNAGVRVKYDVIEDKEFDTRFMIITDLNGLSVQLFGKPIRFR